VSESFLSIRNFNKLQHFNKKRPPWLKLYAALPLDYPFINLQEDAKLTFVFLTIVASEHDNRIPYDIKFLRKRMAISEDTITNGLGELLNVGMVSVSKKRGRKPKAIKRVASGDTNLVPEGEGERERYLEGYLEREPEGER
jgi:hypothetical protein